MPCCKLACGSAATRFCSSLTDAQCLIVRSDHVPFREEDIQLSRAEQAIWIGVEVRSVQHKEEILGLLRIAHQCIALELRPLHFAYNVFNRQGMKAEE